MSKVTIYTTPTCQYCRMAKAFFQENNIEYNEIDVSSNQTAAQEMISKSGQMGVPVIVVSKDGQEEVIVGFDQARLKSALGVGE